MSRQLGQVGQDGLVPDKFDITPGEIHNNGDRSSNSCGLTPLKLSGTVYK